MSLRLIRKLGSIVRGGGSTRDVALGVWLGFALGMVPGANLTMAALILLIVILNCNIGAVFLSMVLGSAVSHGAEEPLYRLGSWMIYDAGLRPLIIELADTPVLAFLAWDNSCVLAGLATGLAGGLVLAVVFSGMIMGIRRAVVKKKDNSDKVEKASGNPFARFFLWVFFGPRKGTLAESLEKRSPIFRKSGLYLVATMVVLLVVGGWAVANLKLAPYAEDAAGKANGAEVNIANLGVSLHGGSVSIEGLQVTKNKVPKLNRFQADTISVSMSVSKLLAKQIVVDKIECKNLRLDQVRAAIGEVIDEGIDFPDLGSDLPELGGEDKSPAEEVLGYIKQVQAIKKYVDMIRDYMTSEPEPELTEEQKLQAQKELGAVEGYRSLSASEILRKHPQWLVREAVISATLDDKFPSVKVILTNLSSDERLAGVKAAFQVLPDEVGLEAYLLDKTGRKGLGKLTVQILKGLDPDASDGEVLRKITTTLLKGALQNPGLILDNIRGNTGGVIPDADKRNKDVVNTALGGLQSILGDDKKDEEKE